MTRLSRSFVPFIASISLLPCSWMTSTASAQGTDLLTRLYAATADDFDSGLLVTAQGGPPWAVNKLAETKGGRLVRSFGKFLYVIDDAHGVILRVKRDGTERSWIDVGARSAPQDIHVKDDVAYVTRRDNARLLRIHLPTGIQTESVDLSVLAHGQAAISLRTMERDNKRLFVQVQFEQGGSSAVPVPGPSGGVLAVVALGTETLIDVDPSTFGIQGVTLAGAPPRLKMQKVDRTLFVSTTDERLDGHGGIEMVDMDALKSVGYALSEAAFGADLGGFVMTSAKEGYFVFHTDIVASTHLKPFSIDGGVPPGLEIVVLLGDFVDSLAHDPVAKQIYLPSGFAGFGATPGIYVVSTVTNQVVGVPVDTVERPHDVIVAD